MDLPVILQSTLLLTMLCNRDDYLLTLFINFTLPSLPPSLLTLPGSSNHYSVLGQHEYNPVVHHDLLHLSYFPKDDALKALSLQQMTGNHLVMWLSIPSALLKLAVSKDGSTDALKNFGFSLRDAKKCFASCSKS